MSLSTSLSSPSSPLALALLASNDPSPLALDPRGPDAPLAAAAVHPESDVGRAMALDDPALYIDPELSWLEFNQRVLEEAGPLGAGALLERLRFLCLSAANLDEFFRVRVAGVRQQLIAGSEAQGQEALFAAPAEVLARVALRAQRMVAEQYRLFRQELQPRLRAPQPLGVGLTLLSAGELDAAQRRFLHGYFTARVYPALTPLAVDPGHPFPHLRNQSLTLAVLLQRDAPGVTAFAGRGPETCFAVVQVPAVLGRLIELPRRGAAALEEPAVRSYVFMEDLIALHVSDLFPGTSIIGCWPFRVTRHCDPNIEACRRDRGDAVRLECMVTMDLSVRRFLARALKLEPQEVYTIDPADGPLNLADLLPLCASAAPGALTARPERTPRPPAHRSATTGPRLARSTAAEPWRLSRSMFEVIADGDVLLHQPYEPFERVLDFLEEAAADPQVLAIKGVLSPPPASAEDGDLSAALVRAAERGKQVTAVCDVQEGQSAWTLQLEDAGVHVAQGLSGLRNHGKVLLVVRREGGGVRRYVHLSTGDHDPGAARLRTDLSLFTCREELGADVSALFNLLTGHSAPPSWQRLSVAPLGLKERVLALIDAEARSAQAGRPARIVAKLNALSDPELIRALYRAALSGVDIDLIVRGVCCLRPGVPGLSERVRVIAHCDRFLEHSRVFCFHAEGRREVYLSSVDWLSHPLRQRVELMFPLEDPLLRARVMDEILGTLLLDNTKAWRLRRDGSYERCAPGPDTRAVRAQQRFLDLARGKADGLPEEPGLYPAVSAAPLPSASGVSLATRRRGEPGAVWPRAADCEPGGDLALRLESA